MRGASDAVLAPVWLALAGWTSVWSWTYPLARPAIAEVRAAAIARCSTLKRIEDALRFAVELPLMARAQHYAERSVATRTSRGATSPDDHYAQLELWLGEPGWRSHLREAMVWATAASWLVVWVSIAASFIFTGNFLFESHATADAPGYVTPYFKVAALAFVLPLGWMVAGAALLGVTRRAV